MATPNDRRGGRVVCALILVLVLARGVMYLCVLPPCEGWDEYQHVGYVQHLVETGQTPVYGETAVPEAVVAAAAALPQPEPAARQLAGTGAVSYADFWRRTAGGPRAAVPAVLPPVGLYQAQHGPLYYRLAAPLFVALGGGADLRRSVAGLRLANVLLTALAVGVVLAALRGVFRRPGDAALVGLALASHPLFLLNGARVASDALGVLLAVVAVALGLRLDVRGRWALPSALALGAAAGLAALAKATNLALLPFLGAAWLAASLRRPFAPGRAVAAGVLVAAGFAAVTQAESRSNLRRYGSVTPMQEGVVNARAGRHAGDLLHTAAAVDWPLVVRRLWVRELFFWGGWSARWTDVRTIQLYQFAATAGLLGWARLGLRRALGLGGAGLIATPAAPALFVVVVAGYTAALGYHRVQSTLAWGHPSTAPWYACPALPWFLALTVAGGLAWTAHPRWRRVRAPLPLLLAVAGLAADQAAVWTTLAPYYAGGATGTAALTRLALLQPGFLGTPTFAAALAAQALALAALAWFWRAGGARPAPTALHGPHARPVPADARAATAP